MFLEILQNSQENTCTRASFLIKLQACNLIKKRVWHRCFPVKFAKFLRTPFLQNTSRRLLLKKKGFLNQHLIKASKLLVFVLLSFFIVSNIMIKIFFSRITVLYWIAKVERKEKTFFKIWNYPFSERKEKQDVSGQGEK